jgi:hypothetical protein
VYHLNSTTVFYHGIPLPTLRMGKQCPVLGSGYPLGKASRNRCAVPALIYASIEDGSNRTAGAPVEPNRKAILIFFAYLLRGARILPCFNGIMVIPLDMTCDQACHHALGSLSRMEHRNRERNELRLHTRSHTGRFDLL